jgi:hypothetical protein
MGYEEAIRTYDRIYRKVDLATLLELWASNRGPLNVYVHSPFCASICRFCYYQGVQFSFESDSATYDRYYASYLPAVVAPFRPMLEAREVTNYFFGGGTPSLMRPDTLRSVFGLFPRFQEVRSKTFEIHPAVWCEEQLDVLAEHGFNCCIIGIQSFDERVLERQRRLHAPFERVLELAQAIRARGMHLAADLIYRMDPIDADEIFARDLALVKQLESDVLSLQLNYDEAKDPAHNERFFQLIEASGLGASHRWELDRPVDLELKKELKCLRLVRNDVPLDLHRRELFPFVNSLDELSKFDPWRTNLPSVIGFGSYRNPRKNTFSNLRGEWAVEYIEVNDDWTPRYYVTYESPAETFFDEWQEHLEKLRTIGPPPRGMKFHFSSRIPVDKEDRIYRRTNSRLDVGVEWAYSTGEIQAYVEKLKQLFPHWKWNG